MEKWEGKVAIVTGASSGIGEETCRLLVKKGMIVVGLARREDRLLNLKKTLGKNFHFKKVDICSEKSILEAFGWVKFTLKSVDVLINNAGVFKDSDLLGDTADWKLMYDTNVIGLNICSREAIKIMNEMKTKGHIININSISGHYILPETVLSVYSSTKFSVTSISEYLRCYMCSENLPIRVTSISPGVVETEMTEVLSLDRLDENAKLKPIDIADAIVYALGAPQRVNVSEIIVRPLSEKKSMNDLWN